MKVLANDGVSQTGIDALEKAGFEVITTKVAQEQLANYINSEQIDVVLVRSATTVRKEVIDACPSLKIIGRGGVGMYNSGIFWFSVSKTEAAGYVESDSFVTSLVQFDAL